MNALKLSQGPARAWPVTDEIVLEDGSKSQEYETFKGTAVVRRTCAPRDRRPGQPSVWWEVNFARSVVRS
jgi:hypothetical protein